MSQAAAITTDFGPEDNENYRSRPRLSYPREAKLQAIQYAKFTWFQKEDGSLHPLSKYQAAQNLGITPIMLKNWIGNEQVILNQTRGSRRRFYRREAKFPEHDKLLYKEFEEARGLGRQITHR